MLPQKGVAKQSKLKANHITGAKRGKSYVTGFGFV